MNIKHIVISGGGLKGISFLGVLEYFQRHQQLKIKEVETFVGCSAGSLIAALLVVGYSVADIFKLIYDCDLEALAEPDVTLLLSEYGVETGRRLLSVLTEMLRQKGYQADLTMKQLFEATGKRLVVSATCVGKGLRYFDHFTSPDLSVLLAVRMSIAVPILFTPVKHEGDFYVDGGLLDNTPIAVLKDVSEDEVLTIRTNQALMSCSVATLPQYLFSIAATILYELEMLREQANECQNLNDEAVVVEAGDHKLSVNNQDKVNLFRAGYKSAKEHTNSQKYLLRIIKSLPANIQKIIYSYAAV